MDPRKLAFECLAIAAIFAIFIVPAQGIRCYQCTSINSSHPFQCSEYLTSDIDMEPTPCDNVFGAQYCIKQVGRLAVLGLECYQCTSAEEWKCMDGDMAIESLQPKSCDHVYDAQYCVKSIGRYGDGIGTQRYCSSLHEGNYCDYVKHRGDSLEYRTCRYTCTGDGCNPASTSKPNTITIIVSSLLVLRVLSFRR